MAKGVYIGIDGAAHKIKKGYIGVDGIARKIKKAYIGVGGVARPCWSGGELAYYGTITPLATPRTCHTSAKAGENALFAGGQNASGTTVKAVEAYNKSLTRTTLTDLDVGGNTIGAYIGGKALFAHYGVDVYDESLTKNSTLSLSVRRYGIGATSTKNHALFAGGYASGSGRVNTVDAFDSSLVRTTGSLSQSVQYPTGGCVGDYALFASGSTGSAWTDIVDAFDSSLTRKTIAKLPGVLGQFLKGATVGSYVLFAGHSIYKNVTAYDESLVKSTVTELSVIRHQCAVVSIGEFGVFAGGSDGSTLYKTIDTYDKALIRQTLTAQLSNARSCFTGETVGDYALLAGGRHTTSNFQGTSQVDALIIS